MAKKKKNTKTSIKIDRIKVSTVVNNVFSISN